MYNLFIYEKITTPCGMLSGIQNVVLFNMFLLSLLKIIHEIMQYEKKHASS